MAGQRLTSPRADNGFGQLLLELVPRERGEVVVDGVEVAYSSGWQRRTVAAGVRTTVTVAG